MKRALLLLSIPVALAACSDSGGPGGQGRVNLSVSGQRSMFAATTASIATAGDSTKIALGTDTVIVRSVDLVLRRIQLKPVEGTACENDDAETAEDATGGTGTSGTQNNQDCDEVETGPVLVTLPLGATPTTAMFDVSAPAGQYDRLEFKIHVPKLPADTAFLRVNPDFPGVSVRVKGTFSHAGTRTDFTYLSDLEADEESPISPPITVAAGGTASLTLRFDVSGWFLSADGTSVVDPATANAGGANADLVKENIQRSINAFEDQDHDGHDDEDQGQEHDGGNGGGEGDG